MQWNPFPEYLLPLHGEQSLNRLTVYFFSDLILGIPIIITCWFQWRTFLEQLFIPACGRYILLLIFKQHIDWILILSTQRNLESLEIHSASAFCKVNDPLFVFRCLIKVTREEVFLSIWEAIDSIMGGGLAVCRDIETVYWIHLEDCAG